MHANKASSTALLISASLLATDEDGGRGAIDPLQRRVSEWVLRHHSAGSRLQLWAGRNGVTRAVAAGLEQLTVPGIQRHYLARKLAIGTLVESAINSGFTRLCILGAGFDTLAAQCARRFPALECVEIDHPATQAWKKDAYANCGANAPNLRLIPCDLSMPADFHKLLQPAAATISPPTLWVAEGLLMYFHVDQVAGLFQSLRECTPRCRLIFTYVEPDRNGRPTFRNPSWIVRQWLALKQEPFLWGVSRPTLHSFLAAQGFAQQQIPDGLCRALYALDVGEYLAVAEVP